MEALESLDVRDTTGGVCEVEEELVFETKEEFDPLLSGSEVLLLLLILLLLL